MVIKTSKHLKKEEVKEIIVRLVDERVVIVPLGVRKFFITSEQGKFIVYGLSGIWTLNEMGEFNKFHESWDCATTIVKELGMTYEDIELRI